MLHVTSKWLLSTIFVAASFLSVSSYTSTIGSSVPNTSLGKEAQLSDPTNRNQTVVVYIYVTSAMKQKPMEPMQALTDEG